MSNLGARNRPDLYEAKTAPLRTWGFLFSKQKITSSQILEMTFGVGNLQPVHAKLVAHFLGFSDDDFRVIDDKGVHPSPADDDRTAELKLFYRIAAIAATANASVFIDA